MSCLVCCFDAIMKSKPGWRARKLDGHQNQLAIGSKNRSYSQQATGLVAGQAESAGVMISRAHLSGCILPANSCPQWLCRSGSGNLYPKTKKATSLSSQFPAGLVGEIPNMMQAR